MSQIQRVRISQLFVASTCWLRLTAPPEVVIEPSFVKVIASLPRSRSQSSPRQVVHFVDVFELATNSSSSVAWSAIHRSSRRCHASPPLPRSPLPLPTFAVVVMSPKVVVSESADSFHFPIRHRQLPPLSVLNIFRGHRHRRRLQPCPDPTRSHPVVDVASAVARLTRLVGLVIAAFVKVIAFAPVVTSSSSPRQASTLRHPLATNDQLFAVRPKSRHFLEPALLVGDAHRRSRDRVRRLPEVRGRPLSSRSSNPADVDRSRWTTVTAPLSVVAATRGHVHRVQTSTPTVPRSNAFASVGPRHFVAPALLRLTAALKSLPAFVKVIAFAPAVTLVVESASKRH